MSRTTTFFALAGAALLAMPGSASAFPTLDATYCDDLESHVVTTRGPDKVTVTETSIIIEPYGRPTVEQRRPRESPLVISTLGGSDTVRVEADVPVVVCLDWGSNTFVASHGGHRVFADDNFAHIDIERGGNVIDVYAGIIELGGRDGNVVRVEDVATVYGGSGDDDIEVDSRAIVHGGGGDDLIHVGGGGEIYGGPGNDHIVSPGRSFVDGGEDDDVIETGNGDDEIVTGSGADQVFAGGGFDRCDASHDASAGPDDTYVDCEMTNAVYDGPPPRLGDDEVIIPLPGPGSGRP